MHHVTPVASRRRRRGWRAGGVLVISLLLAGTGKAHADTTLPTSAAGAVSVDLRATLDYACACQVPASGTSSGDIAGVYSGVAFDVAWPATASVANISGLLGYADGCLVGVPVVGGIVSGLTALTISNALLTYGGVRSAATISLAFGSSTAIGTEMLAAITGITVNGGTVIPLPNIISTGLVHLTRVTPLGTCSAGSQQGWEFTGSMSLAQP